MSDASIKVSSNAAGDRPVDNESVSGHPDGVAYRQRVEVTGAALAEVARVINSTPGGSEYGLAVRQVGSHAVTDGGSSLTVDGTVTADQGVAAAVANSWPVKITNGTDTVGVSDVSGAKALKVDVVQTSGAGGGTSSNVGSAAPSVATAAGVSDGTNMVLPRSFDADTGGGTQHVLGVSLRKAASGGSVEAGTSADPLRVDPTGSTTQPVSGTVTANAGTGTFTTQDSSSLVDNAGFTDGTSRVLPSGHIFDESAGTSLTENDVAASRIDAKRAQVLVIEDETTRGRRTTVTAANALKVDGSAVTQPVSVAASVTVAQSTASSLNAEVQGDAAHDAAVSGNPVLVGGRASAAAPTSVSADGDAVSAWHLRDGSAACTLTAAGALIGGDATNGLDVDVTRVSGNVTVVQSTASSLNAQVQGAAAADAAVSGNPVLLGARASTAIPAAMSADGDAVSLWATRRGVLNTHLVDGAGDSVMDDTNNAVQVSIVASSVGGGDGAILDGVSGAIKATVFDFTNSNPLAVVLRDTNGDYVSVGGGTQYTEDVAAATDPVGNMLLARRRDSLSAETNADGDNVACNATNKGEIYVKHVDAIPVTDNGSSLTVDGTVTANAGTGTFVVGDGGGSLTVDGSVSISGSATVAQATASSLNAEVQGDAAHDAAVSGNPVLMGAYASSTAPTNVSANGDAVNLWADLAGRLQIGDGGGTLTVDDGASSLTIDNAALSVTGGGTESGALRITVASDSTGVLSVDDNGSSLTVDGTVTANAGSGTFTVAGTVTANAGTGTMTVGGVAATDAAVSGNPVYCAGRASAAAPADVSADGDVVPEWRLRNGAGAVVVTAAGALVGGDATNGLDVDVTRVGGNVTVVQATASNLKAQVQGEAAADAAVSGNPLLGGLRASAAVPTAVSADGDAVSAWGDLQGRAVAVLNATARVAADSTIGPKRVAVTASGDTSLVAAPGASTSIYVTSCWLSNRGAAAITAELRDGTTARFGGMLAADGGGVTHQFNPPWKLTANTALNGNLSAAGDVYMTIHYFCAPQGSLAISFFGDARRPATDGANSAATSATITPPGSMAANDYVVVFVSAKTTGVTITNSVTGGQTWTAETDAEGSGLSFRTFHCRFNGTWSADPAWSWTNSVPYQVWMVVFRGVDTTTGVDAIDTTPNTFAAPSSPFDVTIAASTISTSTANCMLVACWTSADDNTWSLQTGGWTNPGGQAQWRNAGGTDSSMAVAYMIQAASGNNAAVTNRQSALGGDAGINMILALRPAAVTGPAAGLRTLGLAGCGIQMLLDLHQLIYGGDVVVAPPPVFTRYTMAKVGLGTPPTVAQTAQSAAGVTSNGTRAVVTPSSQDASELADFTLKRGDRIPALELTLYNADGTPMDLTGRTVRFMMRLRSGSTNKVDAAASIVSATGGQVSYSWGATDTDTAGSYIGEVETSLAGLTQTVPSGGYLSIDIVSDLG